jgi:hypothetical protein
MRPNTTEARPRGPNQPTKATVARSRPVRASASAAGVLQTGDQHHSAEAEPDEHGQQDADFLGERQAGLVVVVVRGAEGHATDEGCDEAVRPGSQRDRIGEEGEGQDGQRSEGR